MPENYYDPATGAWVTRETRYEDLVAQPRYASLNSLIYDDPERAWPLLLELIAATPADLIGFVGAGPVETFIWRNGPAFIERIERETKTNSRFRDAAFEINLAEGNSPKTSQRESLLQLEVDLNYYLLNSFSCRHTSHVGPVAEPDRRAVEMAALPPHFEFVCGLTLPLRGKQVSADDECTLASHARRGSRRVSERPSFGLATSDWTNCRRRSGRGLGTHNGAGVLRLVRRPRGGAGLGYAVRQRSCYPE